MRSVDRPGYLPQLDGVRAISVILVLLAHGSSTGGTVGEVFWHAVEVLRTGYIGVDLFFALSGFLITRLLLAEHRNSGIRFGRFFARRAVRIVPIYYLALGVVLLLSPAEPGLRFSLLTYTFNYYHPDAPAPFPVEHVWSLAVEEQFYLVWPFVVAVVPLARLRTVTLFAGPLLAVSAAVLLAATLPAMEAGRLIYTSLPTRAFTLMLGAYLAVREAGHDAVPVRAAAATALLGAATLAGTVVSRALGVLPPGGPYWCFALVGYGLLAAGMVGGAAAPDAPAVLVQALSWRPLRLVGRVSYGLYLYHLPIFYLLRVNQAALAGQPAPALRLAAAYGISFGVATVSFVVIERPLLRWAGALMPAREPASAG